MLTKEQTKERAREWLSPENEDVSQVRQQAMRLYFDAIQCRNVEAATDEQLRQINDWLDNV